MDPKNELAALQAEAEELRKKSDLSEEDIARVDEIAKRVPELEDILQRREDALGKLAAFSAASTRPETPDVGGDVELTGTLGERFVKSSAMRAFRSSTPEPESKDHVISITAKAIGSKRSVFKADPAPLNTRANGDLAPVRLPGIEDVTYRKPATLLDLITQGTTDAPWLQYRQLVSVTNNASIVGEAVTTSGTNAVGGLKPLSTLTTRTADAKAFTYADGIEVTNQELKDDGALTALIDGILTQNVRLKIEDVVLNGAGTADEPAGIMHTTGVLQQAFATDALVTLRKAKTLLQETSATSPTAVVLNPEDEEALDLLKTTTGEYLRGGPWAQPQTPVWGVTPVTSSKVPVGTAIMGDFNAVQLLVYEALSVLAFNQHKDYAQRNLTYVRAELRGLQLIRQPAKLAIVDIKGA